ncbi:cytochrome P450 [Streptomyces sp. NPDC049040]|uniref:cytochrome P450 n=1 Tax=Streptomyces sp. NPDC049040 TaxID=3365593 RepID=UPI003717CD93
MTTAPELPVSARGCPVLHGESFAAHSRQVYEQLREQGPAGWAEIAPGVHALVVTARRAAVDMLNDPATYAKDSRLWGDLASGRVPADSPVLPLMGWRPSVLYADDEVHARLRSAMDDCIARISPHRLREITRRSALTLVSRIAEQGRADLMADFADTLPLLVFAELLGCPSDMAARMVRSCQILISTSPDAAQGAIDFAGLLFELIRLRHQEPGDDLTSWMLGHDAGLSDEETLHQLYCAVGAGVIPTAAWVGWALHLLLRDDSYAGSLAAGTVTVRRALEKALWVRSPMANFSVHYARRDTSLHGVPVPAGAPVLVSHAAANTDPALPADLGYDNRSHLAWSAGPHRCPAVSQATVIAQTGIETALDQLWDMQLAVTDEEVPLRHGPFHQCPVAMPVTFRPKSAAAIAAAAAPEGGTQ